MRVRFVLLSSPALLLATTCTPALAQQPAQRSLAEVCPNLTPEEIAGIENYKDPYAENALYARAYCVSVEEAERRMEIQLRDAVKPKSEPGLPPPPPEDSIGAVSAAVQKNEAATFAGLWIQHRPDYRVVVAFTRDAAATLAKYTRDPLFKPLDRPGPTLAELRRTQEQLVAALNRHGFRWAGAGAREDKGVVEITLAQEARPIRAAAASGAFALPDWVVLVEPPPLPFPAPPPPAAGDTRVKAFPQLAFRTDMYPSTLVGVPDVPATLRLVSGCLVLEAAQGTRTALWQASDALDLTDPARVTVVDRLSGIRVAAGEAIVLSGLQPGEERVPENIADAQGCPGPYRVVRGFLPRAVWDKQQREQRIGGRQQTGVTRERAAADLAADQARLPVLRKWQQRTLAESGDVVAAISIDEDQATAHVFRTAATTREQLAPDALLPFVTAQVVPVGHTVLERARASLERQLAAADIGAELYSDPLEGVVRVRPADLRVLSRAASEGRIAFPPASRVEFEGAQPIYDDQLRQARDPEAVWLRLEAAPDFAAIRRLVEATPLPVVEPSPPRGTGSASGRAPTQPVLRYVRPSRAASLSSAHFLVAYGQTAKEIAALKARGFDPIDALDAMNGRATALTKALLARQVVLAELVRLDTRDTGKDGYRTTATWRVLETLKGSAAPGETLRVRMVSGEEPEGRIAQSNEEPPILPGLPGSLVPGGRWLLHLNDALYQHMAFIHGGAGAGRAGEPWYVAIEPPAEIVDGVAKGRLSGQQPMPLDQLRATLSPLQAAMVEYRKARATSS